MKKLNRTPIPTCWDDNDSNKAKKRKRFYHNLRDDKGKIKPRWRKTCLDENGYSHIQTHLLAMSKGHCAYCGKKIGLDELDVDHFLPKESFPYLAYCWENYLPSCKSCNQNLKHDISPASLAGKVIVEEIMKAEVTHDYVYNKAMLLGKIVTKDRIIDPSFDVPEDHLDFNPASLSYTHKTSIGKYTIDVFWSDQSCAEEWLSLSQFIQSLVINSSNMGSLEKTISSYIQLHGQEYVVRKLLNYWKGILGK